MTASFSEAMANVGLVAAKRQNETHLKEHGVNEKKTSRRRNGDTTEEKFYNPYHFVPVGPGKTIDKWRPCDLFFHSYDYETGYWSHKRYATLDHENNPFYHGRIVCNLTTETPTFIGAIRGIGSEEAPAVVSPFELNREPAIPATSLRGLVSSVAEAASNSALRVLEDRALSYRASMPGLSAIGMIFIDTDSQGNKCYRLQPLCLPTLKMMKDGSYGFEDGRYKKMFIENAKTPRLKVLINQKPYYRLPDSKDKKVYVKSHTRESKEFYYMNLKKDWKFTEKDTITDAIQVYNPSNKSGGGVDKKYCIGQKSNVVPNDFVPGSQATSIQKADWTRGIMRVLDLPDKEVRGLPRMRRHEIFIPYPEEAEEWKKYPIPDEVIKTFYKLSDERTDAAKKHELPYEPFGTIRNDNKIKEGDFFRLKTGDIVYFLPDETGVKAEEIALSAIWRKGPKIENRLATTYDFFRKLDPELLPFNKERTQISPAEMVFGFVENRDADSESQHAANQNQSLAYAGRVKFTHGIFQPETGKECDDPYLPEVTLKILDTPKPPSPAFYFTKNEILPKGTMYIDKKKLNVCDHKPQGRKYYLHHGNNDRKLNRDSYATHFDEAYFSKEENKDEIKEKGRFIQKVKIRPMMDQLTFSFHIDFENLNKFELGMLCYALRPNKQFRHKIGMGKPLGLGTVRIDPVHIDFINREKRYMDESPFTATRYNLSCPASDVFMDGQSSDTSMADLPSLTSKMNDSKSFIYFRDNFKNIMKKIHQIGIHALETIGNPDNTKDALVQYPQISHINGVALNNEESELEHFRWWIANDKGSKSDGRPPVFKYDPGKISMDPIDINSGLKQLPKHKFAIKK